MWPYLPENPCGCDSCESSNESTTNVGSDNIRYVGPSLACTGIESCDSLTTVLQKIDNTVCGILNILDVCCTTTTTSTTVIPVNPYCYEVTAVNRCTIYWIDANGDTQSQNVTNGTINICADEDSIASSCGAGGGITVTGGTVACTNDAICQPLPTTTTTTTVCNNPNLIVNSTFDSSLIGWSQAIFGSWQWSSFNGGSAHYTGQDEFGNLLYQDVLTPGTTYDITFDLWMNDPTCPNPLLFYLEVYAGDTVYGPFNIVGNQTINLILTCTNTSRFGIRAYDTCESINTIFVDNVNVSVHCPQFTTTTSTTTPVPVV